MTPKHPHTRRSHISWSRWKSIILWRREAKELIKLAGPLAATQLAAMLVIVTDVMLLGHYSKDALAGSTLGLAVYLLTFQVGMGITAAVAPMIAQIRGANPNNLRDVRRVTRMGLWVCVIITIPICIALQFTTDILLFLHQKPELAEAAGQFIRPISFGVPFSLGYQTLRNSVTALDRPKAPMVVMALTILFNLIVDYGLIYGRLGMPEMGLIGSGIAGASAYAFSFIVMALIIRFTPDLHRYRFMHHLFRPDWAKFREIFRLGVPIGLTTLFEIMLFDGTTFMMGTFGTTAIAAHQIAINLSCITFMVPLGIGMAATVRIGKAAGAGNPAGVRRAGYSALLMSFLFMSSGSVLIALFPHFFAGLYLDSSNLTNAGAIMMTVSFLHIVACYQIFDGLQVTGAFALRGLKDARVPMYIAGLCYWLIGIPACYLLSKKVGFGPIGIWYGLAIALFCAALAQSGRFVWLARRMGPANAA